MEWSKNKFLVTTNKNKFDFDFIHDFLSSSAYWCTGIPKETLEKAINNSFCFGLFFQEEQIGFARLISDRATFAYLADVFITEKFRGQDLSKFLMSCILQHPEVSGLRRIMLATADAHGLYEKFEFEAITNPEFFMQIHRPNIYKTLEKA
ncbi:GNAT family N-acetyltransferase [Endozoicomonas ascidiicola]|uniref:GNAT family N-acetyltransferase n=1 Tax=Endozoicomonas ascidiicola TaxID=1698521 RepID=UPI0008345ED0|nr:GNAT family N-acetyltransferase [Endozoicomonas ascidiicola]